MSLISLRIACPVRLYERFVYENSRTLKKKYPILYQESAVKHVCGAAELSDCINKVAYLLPL